MSKDLTTAPGAYHVILKLKGDQRRADLFHEIVRRCDPSWPWKTGMYSRVQQCDSCEGLVFSSPRVNASDIKSAAKQAAVKVTIVRFAPSEKCVTEANKYQRSKWIDIGQAHELYRSKAWVEAHRVKSPLALLPSKETVPSLSAFSGRPSVDTTRVINIGAQRPATHTIYPDGTCECVCHDRPMDLKFVHTTGAGCCAKVWKPREHPVQPAIISATAVCSANGEILDGDVDTGEEITATLSERRLMDQIIEAERDVAGSATRQDTPGGDLPWGGGYVN